MPSEAVAAQTQDVLSKRQPVPNRNLGTLFTTEEFRGKRYARKAKGKGVKRADDEPVTILSTVEAGEIRTKLVGVDMPDRYKTKLQHKINKPTAVEDAKIAHAKIMDSEEIKAIIWQYAIWKTSDGQAGEIWGWDEEDRLLVQNDVASIGPRKRLSVNALDWFFRYLLKELGAKGFCVIFPLSFADKWLKLLPTSIAEISVDQQDSICEEIRKFLLGVDFMKPKNALARIGYWFFPWLSDDHYRVFVVDCFWKACFVLDSQDVKEAESLILVHHGLHLARILFYYMKHIGKIDVDIGSFSFEVLYKVPKQKDITNCGVFATKFCECYRKEWRDGAIYLAYFVNWRLETVVLNFRKLMFELMVLRPDNKCLPMLLERAIAWKKPDKKKAKK